MDSRLSAMRCGTGVGNDFGMRCRRPELTPARQLGALRAAAARVRSGGWGYGGMRYRANHAHGFFATGLAHAVARCACGRAAPAGDCRGAGGGGAHLGGLLCRPAGRRPAARCTPAAGWRCGGGQRQRPAGRVCRTGPPARHAHGADAQLSHHGPGTGRQRRRGQAGGTEGGGCRLSVARSVADRAGVGAARRGDQGHSCPGHRLGRGPAAGRAESECGRQPAAGRRQLAHRPHPDGGA